MKNFIYAGLFTAMLAFASCAGTGKSQSSDSASAGEQATAVSMPLESGEYRAVSFQDTVAGAKRTVFDGRLLLALDPDNSAVYIYENGNRTHFKAKAILSKPFAQVDSVYTTTDSEGREITLIPGNQVDTLLLYRSGKPVKVAFENKPMSVLSPTEVWTRISNVLSK